MNIVRGILLICIVCSWVPSAWGVALPVVDDNIHINADHMNQSLSDSVYTAEGNVVVMWQGMTLNADKVRYAATAHVMYATGSVVLSKGSTLLKGQTLVMNLDTGRAELDATVVTIPDLSLTISADKLIRINENEFKATTSELTTCDMPNPDWKFGAAELDVNMSGYATGRNVIFYVNNMPVLYIPWIAFPVVLEKKSGLLFPRFGRSTSRGVQLDIPVYWVISPSQDLLFDLDLTSLRGVGTGLDYRYIRTRDSEGHVSVYQIHDQLAERWRWQFAQEHKEVFSKNANLRMTVNATSDRTFLNDFGEKSGDYNRQSSETVINTLNTWRNYAVTSSLRYSEDLYAADNRATTQTLPSVGVAAVRQSIFSSSLYFDLDSTVENLYSITAPSGQRLALFPRISVLPLQDTYYLKATFFAGVHIRGYATDKRDGNAIIRSSDGTMVPEAGGRLSTSLARVYDVDFQQVKKLRHEFVPELSYVFVPEQDQQRLPFYDYSDRIIHQNIVTLSATSVLSGKRVRAGTTEYLDISRIKISLRQSFAGERRDLLTLVDNQHRWSDLVFESDTWLTRQLRLTLDTRYDLYGRDVTTVSTGAEIDDKQGNSIGIAYQMARDQVEYFEGRLTTKLITPLNISYTARYSFDRSDFLESIYAAEYRHKCWSVNLALHQRPGNQSYTINFNLAGMGSK